MEGRGATSWLCREEFDRERLLDMEQRLRPKRTLALAILGISLIVSGPWLGWWTLIPLAGASAGFAIVNRGLARSLRPEYRLAGAWMLAQLAIAASVLLTGGIHSPGLPWLAIPIVTLGARFSDHGVRAGVAATAVLILVATVARDPGWALNHPAHVLSPLAMLFAIAILSTALMHSDLDHRSAAVIDPLTSMLNRASLDVRAAELAAQAQFVREPIGVVVGDIDRFKAVNDEHGHAFGDAVLRDVAYRMRRELRAYDLGYRIGGEEFVVLMPGASADQAAAVAESLRLVVEADPVAGVAVTMSFGVAVARPGEFDYAATFASADAALYAAKEAGRNRVMVAGDAPALRIAPTAAWA